MSYSPDSDFILVYLSDGKQGLYGFYNCKSPKFHPITTDHARVFALISFLSGPELVPLLARLGISYRTHHKDNSQAIFPLDPKDVLVDNFLPASDWTPFKPDHAHYGPVMDHLYGVYGPYLGGVAREAVELWYGALEFSSRYVLLEVQCFHRGGNHRFYLLFDFNWGDPFNFRSSMVDGRSNPIHDIWDAQREVPEKDFVLDSPGKLRAYLAFFCWAVEGEEGHFILPTPEEMPWTRAPDGKLDLDHYRGLISRGKLRELDVEGTQRLLMEDIVLAYGTALFQATFEIDPGTGMLEMVDDLPLAADLPFSPSFFGRLLPRGDGPLERIPGSAIAQEGESTVHHRGGQGEENSPAPQGTGGDWHAKERALDMLIGGLALSDVGALKTLEGENALDRARIRERIYINDFLKLARPVAIRNCIFEGELCFMGDEYHGKIEFHNCVFKRTVSAHGAALQCHLVFRDCIFQGNMDLQGNGDTAMPINFHNFKGGNDLIFEDCHFFGHALMTNMNLFGNLVLAGCSFSTLETHIPRLYVGPVGEGESLLQDQKQITTAFANLDISQSRINGKLMICGHRLDKDSGPWRCSFVGGSIEASALEVNGDVEFDHCFVNYYVDFTSSQFKRSVKMVREEYQFCAGTKTFRWQVGTVQTKILGQVNFMNCSIGGSLMMSHLETEHEIYMYGAQVNSYVHVFGVSCHGLNLNFSNIQGGFYAYRNDFSRFSVESLLVKGDLTLSSARINIVRLEAVKITGELLARTGEFNHFCVSGGWGPDKGGSRIRPQQSRVKRIDLRSVHILGDMDLAGINAREGISMGGSRIEGSLLFFNETMFESMNRLFSDEVEIDNMPELVAVESEFLVKRKNFEARSGQEFEREEVDFLKWMKHHRFRSRVGEFSIQGKEAHLELLALDVSGNLDLRNLEVDGHIRVDNTRVRGDLEASGILIPKKGRLSLEVVDGLQAQCKEFSMRSMHLDGEVMIFGLKTWNDFMGSGSKIKGGLFLVADEKGQFRDLDAPRQKYLAEIGGNFDVSVSEIKELAITDDNFVSAAGRINLERTLLDKFRILDPTPQGITLTGTLVNQWDFGNGNGPGQGGAEDYLKVLANMSPFDRLVYIDIEKAFRNRSEDQKADAVYIRMRERERWENRDSWRWPDKLWDLVYRHSTRYGTNFGRLLLLWLGLVLVLSFLLWHFGALAHAQGGTLGFWDSLLYAFQSNIPLFELMVVPHVEIPELGWKYAVFCCTILSYIMLSIALFGFSTRISRTK